MINEQHGLQLVNLAPHRVKSIVKSIYVCKYMFNMYNIISILIVCYSYHI